jgi:hypothetical protein
MIFDTGVIILYCHGSKRDHEIISLLRYLFAFQPKIISSISGDLFIDDVSYAIV